MRLVAFSAHAEDDVDANRSGAILARRTLPRALELVREAGAHRAERPVLIPSDPGLADRVGMPVRHRGVVLGYLVCTVAKDRPLGEDDESTLVAAATDLGPLLHDRSLDERRREQAGRAAVTALLDPDPDVRRGAGATLLASGLPPAPRHLAVAVAPPTGLSPEELLVEATTAARFGTVVDGDVVVLVLPVVVDVERAVRRLHTDLSRGVRVGVGDPREDLEQVVWSYDEARLALTATARDPERYDALAAWSDLGADRLLLRLPLETLRHADLPPVVRRLLEAPGGEDLARTVEAYLEHGTDARATAQALSIHRSTLYYRLDRASALSGTDLRDGALRHELHVGLRVATLAGLRPAGAASGSPRSGRAAAPPSARPHRSSATRSAAPGR